MHINRAQRHQLSTNFAAVQLLHEQQRGGGQPLLCRASCPSRLSQSFKLPRPCSDAPSNWLESAVSAWQLANY
eukprot:1161645-Pelagomonas_calceolata.AAC.6